MFTAQTEQYVQETMRTGCTSSSSDKLKVVSHRDGDSVQKLAQTGTEASVRRSAQQIRTNTDHMSAERKTQISQTHILCSTWTIYL